MHKPVRMCIICRERFLKSELHRLVVTDKTLHLDVTGKINARGAYICNNRACLEKAKKHRILQGKLGCEVPSKLWETIEGFYL